MRAPTPAPSTLPECEGHARARRMAVRRVRGKYSAGALRIQRYVADVYSGGWFFTREDHEVRYPSSRKSPRLGKATS